MTAAAGAAPTRDRLDTDDEDAPPAPKSRLGGTASLAACAIMALLMLE